MSQLCFLIIPNRTKTETLSFAKELIGFLRGRNHRCCVMPEIAPYISDDVTVASGDGMRDVNIAIVLGGDGTVLRSVKRLAGYDIPIMGVNFGRLGYLTECEPHEAFGCIEKIINNEYHIEERAMLSGELINGASHPTRFTALNEAVISRGTLSRPVMLRLSLSGNHVGTFAADGILVATPTGSTAYNLSAGGPILDPCSDSFVITPVCSRAIPHCSIVASANDIIEIEVLPETCPDENEAAVALSIDGNTQHSVSMSDRVRITRAANKVKLIKTKEESFYNILRRKLS